MRQCQPPASHSSKKRPSLSWLAGLALASTVVAGACGGSGPATASRPSGASPGTTTRTGDSPSTPSTAYNSGAGQSSGEGGGGVQIIPPQGSAGIDSAMDHTPTGGVPSGDSGTGAGGAGPAAPGGGTATAPASAQAQVYSAYRSFLADVSGLDDDFQPHWVQSLLGVASPQLVQAATRAASTIQEAKEHGVGTLADSHFAVKVTGGVATITDCLDEYHWYIESDSSSQPDAAVARGYFTGSGTVTLQKGAWIVTAWTAGSKRCQF